MVVDLEPRIIFRPSVGTAKIGQHVESVFYLQKAAGIDDRFARNRHGYLAMTFDNAGNPVSVFFSKLIDKFQKHKKYNLPPRRGDTERRKNMLLNLCVSASRR